MLNLKLLVFERGTTIAQGAAVANYQFKKQLSEYMLVEKLKYSGAQ